MVLHLGRRACKLELEAVGDEAVGEVGGQLPNRLNLLPQRPGQPGGTERKGERPQCRL